MATPLRFAACNEIFQNRSLADACSAIHRAGYTGVELAPFTLAENVADLSAEERRGIRQTIADNQLSLVGLHWILASPKGLHATTSDTGQRRRTWQFLRSLVDLCVDINPDPASLAVLVFGSPKQRSTVDGASRTDATNIFVEELSRLAPHAAEANVQILIEPLSPDQSDVLNTLEEAAAIVDQIGSPAIQTMFDVHNAVNELLPHTELLRRYLPYIRHVHVNELDGQEPGRGDYNFQPLLATLTELGYSGWVSLEAFDFSRDPSQIVSAALRHLRQPFAADPILQTL